MAGFAKTMSEEVRRLARKEVRAATADLQKRTLFLRKQNTQLKQQLSELARAQARLEAELKKGARPVAEAEGERARITAKGIRALRRKWGFTREQFAKLLQATPQSVYQWESKEGALNLREKSRTAYLSVRSLGARDARRLLDDTAAKAKKKPGRKSKARK